ncbi:MAG: MATE family multidrug resistance protein [Planctomycetota bacterium]|jgi:MATE family multidrug resistance protein
MSQIFIGLTDTWYLGKLEGNGPLASMAQSGVIYLIVFLIFSSCFMGIQSLTARRYGEQDDEACGIVFNNGLVLQIAIGLLVGLLGVTLMDDIVQLVFAGNPKIEAVLPLASGYLEIRVGGFVVVSLLWAFRGFFYGIGITRPDIWAGVVMNVLNIALNHALVLGNFGCPKLGVDGAAWASVIATAVVAVGMVGLAMQSRYRVTYGLFRLRGFSFKIIKAILKLSAPRALQAVAFGGSIYFFKVISDECGETALASSIIVWRVLGIMVMTGLAFGAAAGTLLGQSLGAKDPELAERYGWAAARIGFGFNASLGLFGFLFPAAIIGVFTDDPEVIELGTAPLRLVVVFGCLDAVGIILARALSAAGATMYVMYAEIVVSIGAVIPFLLLVQKFLPGNLTAIWSAWVVYMVAWFSLMAYKFRTGSWKSIKI